MSKIVDMLRTTIRLGTGIREDIVVPDPPAITLEKLANNIPADPGWITRLFFRAANDDETFLYRSVRSGGKITVFGVWTNQSQGGLISFVGKVVEHENGSLVRGTYRFQRFFWIWTSTLSFLMILGGLCVTIASQFPDGSGSPPRIVGLAGLLIITMVLLYLAFLGRIGVREQERVSEALHRSLEPSRM